jgi:hypothetical protein
MDANAMTTVVDELKFNNPFNKIHPFYVLIEVASNREGPENAERLYDLLGKSENIMTVMITNM